MEKNSPEITRGTGFRRALEAALGVALPPDIDVAALLEDFEGVMNLEKELRPNDLLPRQALGRVALVGEFLRGTQAWQLLDKEWGNTGPTTREIRESVQEMNGEIDSLASSIAGALQNGTIVLKTVEGEQVEYCSLTQESSVEDTINPRMMLEKMAETGRISSDEQGLLACMMGLDTMPNTPDVVMQRLYALFSDRAQRVIDEKRSLLDMALVGRFFGDKRNGVARVSFEEILTQRIKKLGGPALATTERVCEEREIIQVSLCSQIERMYPYPRYPVR